MIHNIDDSIIELATPVESLKPLERNPRQGDVAAIKASYSQFGQLKPIVAVEDEDGKFTVIAGNHQLRAAKELGWQEIAVAVVSLSEQEALAFALADNKISELGSNDGELLFDLISEVSSSDFIQDDLFDAIGWDDFAVASMENKIILSEVPTEDDSGAWTAPQIVVSSVPPTVPSGEKEDGSPMLAPTTINPVVPTETIVTQGSTSTKVDGGNSAAIQFTLVFSSAEEQSIWYSFLRWLKSNSDYSGETTTERLVSFIEAYMED